ncbi:hypothetical protein EMCRGX_G031520 [Ephydatia muelleri]
MLITPYLCGPPVKQSPQKLLPLDACWMTTTGQLQQSSNPGTATVLHELPCRALVCTACLVEWFKVFNCSELIQTLLTDIVLECKTCRKEIQAVECSGEPTKAEVQTASHVLRSTHPYKGSKCLHRDANYPRSMDDTNLHSALDRFRDQVKQLQGMKWKHVLIVQ